MNHPSRLQPGIYYRPGQRPRPCYRLLLLDVAADAGASDVVAALAELAPLIQGLRDGQVPELLGQDEDGVAATKEQFADLALLIGYGRRLFDPDSHKPELVAKERPAFLAYLDHPGEAFPKLPWAAEATTNQGQADICLQFTADNEAAVNRAAIEVWKLVAEDGYPLQAQATFSGFGRSDGRGWLEFHDGVSNLASAQREAALTTAGEPAWMAGGTYMVFLRLAVDLRLWRRLTRSQQELLIGRDKLSGLPLSSTERDADGTIKPIPVPAPDQDSSYVERAAYHDPPQTTDPILEVSHTHRANQNRASAAAPGGLRIFRQGYDFLEQVAADGPRLGLNFVSFQADLATLQHILHLPGWLGDVNFAGSTEPRPGEPEQVALLSLIAGGFYAVPPVAEPFPGATLFDDVSSAAGRRVGARVRGLRLWPRQ